MKGKLKDIFNWLDCNAVTAIVAANIAMFAVVRLAILFGADPQSVVGAVAVYAQPLEMLRHPQGVLLYMFVQFDFMHLMFNMLWLWAFGLLVKRLAVGGAQVALAYGAGGMAGALVFVAMGAAGLSQGMLVGSSAAVLGLVCYVSLRRDVKVTLMLIGTVRLKWLAVFVVALTLLSTATAGLWSETVSHAAGALAGVVMAMAESRRHSGRMRSAVRRQFSHNNAMGTRLSVQENAELDELLLYVRDHGYTALSSAERSRLFQLTRKGQR